MVTQLLSPSSLPRVPRMHRKPAKESSGMDRVGRFIQITLAIYLLPVFLAVAVMTGVGMMVVGISGTVHGLSDWGKHTIRGDQ